MQINIYFTFQGIKIITILFLLYIYIYKYIFVNSVIHDTLLRAIPIGVSVLAVQFLDIVVWGLFSPLILNSQKCFRLLAGVPSTLNAVFHDIYGGIGQLSSLELSGEI